MDNQTLNFRFLTPPQSRDHSVHNSPLKMNHGELAESIAMNGQMALLKGDLQAALKCFDEALKLDPSNPKLIFIQGLSLFDYGNKEENARILCAASKKFKMAAALEPRHFETWQAWGSVLRALGEAYGEQHYYEESQQKLSHALLLSQGQPTDVIVELHVELAKVRMHLATYSGEALDLHEAIESYERALTLQKTMPAEFWHDFGSTCYQFALQINDSRFYIKAITCLKQALSLAPQSSTHWQALAHVFHSLYAHTHDEHHFEQANDCFSAATQLQPDKIDAWFSWAKFLCESTRRQGDLKRLRTCIDTCQHAFSLDPEHLGVQTTWAEALAKLGMETEKLDLINDAQDKISSLIEITEDEPELWFAYGMILKALGHYFNDMDYLYQAIEKFQTGLSIDRTCHTHWHAIAQLYSIMGDLEGDTEALERSFRFYLKAIDLHPSTYYTVDYAIALSKLGEITHTQQWYEEAMLQFEYALHLQKNAAYLHPDWLFHYACTLDAIGDFYEEESYYLRAIDLFSQVLMIEPDGHTAHHRLALTLAHLGELTRDKDHFYRAIHHLRLASKHDEENDVMMVDWATTLINLGYHTLDAAETAQFYSDAEHKLWAAIRLGNSQAFYHLTCLFSLSSQCDKAMQCLRKAFQCEVLPPLDELLQDEWLDNLRATGEFIEFLAQLEQRRNLQEEC